RIHRPARFPDRGATEAAGQPCSHRRDGGRTAGAPGGLTWPGEGCTDSSFFGPHGGSSVAVMSQNITLNNSVAMPALGFGVFQTPPEQTKSAVAEALRVGYRLIDTAASYGNEREVGEGIRASGLERSEVFIETKLWISDYGYDQALHAFDKSAGKLGVEQIDLLLLHQPLTSDFERTIGAYRALEKLLADGKVRAIGISNFMPEVLERLLAETSVVPAVNQIEVHPYFSQPEVQRADAEHGILTQAWSPMGGITSYW